MEKNCDRSRKRYLRTPDSGVSVPVYTISLGTSRTPHCATYRVKNYGRIKRNPDAYVPYLVLCCLTTLDSRKTFTIRHNNNENESLKKLMPIPVPGTPVNFSCFKVTSNSFLHQGNVPELTVEIGVAYDSLTGTDSTGWKLTFLMGT
jgi:hypothetical protein